MHLAERLKKARKLTGKSQKEFGDAIGQPEHNVAAYEQGRAEPDIHTLAEISTVTGIDINWLASEVGEMLIQDRFKSFLARAVKENSTDTETQKKYNLKTQLRLVATIPAGIGEITDRSEWHEWLPIDFNPEKDVVLEVSKENGESMMPFMNVGDYAIITDSIKVKPGDLVAALWTKHSGAIKVYDEQNGNAILLSYNPTHTPIILPKSKVKMYFVKSIIKRRR